jgi:Spy/CpxP family protein refolding chaperone
MKTVLAPLFVAVVIAAFTVAALAQTSAPPPSQAQGTQGSQPPPPPGCPPPMSMGMGPGGPGMGPGGPGTGMGPHMGRGQGVGPGMGMGPGMGAGPRGKWWNNSELVKRLGLSDSQVQQIEAIFQRQRPQLIDLQAALQKQEVALEPLVEAEHPDEAQVTAQIDRIAQARANLEKSNAQMLLAIRRVLTLQQWKQLRSQVGMRPIGWDVPQESTPASAGFSVARS